MNAYNYTRLKLKQQKYKLLYQLDCMNHGKNGNVFFKQFFFLLLLFNVSNKDLRVIVELILLKCIQPLITIFLKKKEKKSSYSASF